MSVNKKNVHKKPNIQHKTQINILGIIPLILIVAVVPLIIYIKVTKLNAVESWIMGSNKTQTDMFSYYKMVWFLIFSTASLIALLFVRDKNLFGKEKHVYYILAGLFVLLVLLSSIASEFKSTAFLGFWGRYEGALVLTAYIGVMFAAMNILQEEKHIKILLICLFISAAVISLLGALQLFGIDYFKSDFVLNLITPAALKKGGGHMEATFGTGTLFSTLYNPNYVGSYMAMLMPMVIVFIVYFKKLSHKLILAALLCLVLLNWIGCNSFSGVVGGGLSLAIILLVFRKKILEHRVTALTAIVLLCGGILVLNLTTNGSISNKIKNIITTEGSDRVQAKAVLDKALQGLADVTIDSTKTRVVTDKGTFQIAMSGNSLVISDGDNKEIPSTIANNTIQFTDSRFTDIKLTTKPAEGLIEIFYNDYNLIGVVFTKEGFKSSSNRWMTDRHGKAVESFGFKGNESFATNRGYIWSRTIPLLKKAVLLGYGPDTFPIYFPQYDYIGKLKNYETGGIFVDKAHNMYLQTAMNSGVISLLALLGLFGIYFISSCRIYFREKFESFLSFAGLACFTAFIGYAVAGLANDSVISVAPVFWVLLGLGIGINLRIAKNKAIVSNNK